MRAGGINWLAALVAAIAIYAVGFIIYGVMVDQCVDGRRGADRSGISAGRRDADAVQRVMPLATAQWPCRSNGRNVQGSPMA